MSHYFSRIHLERHALDSRQLLQVLRGDANSDHRLIWQLFTEEGAERDFLFRAERDAQGWPQFLVVSARPPQEVPGLLWVDDCKPYTPKLRVGDVLQFQLRANPTEVTEQDISPDKLALYNQQRLANGKSTKERRAQRQFHDVIMAAKKRHGHPLAADATEVQRQAMNDAADQAARDWFVHRAERIGLVIQQRENLFTEALEPALDWEGYTQHTLPRKGKTGKEALTFSSLEYRGLVKVTDPTKLLPAITQGLGRAKAFGCGLMLVRRV